jgi:hypothetical protein
VLLPGYGYASTAAAASAGAAAAATLCPVGTWSEGLRSSLTPCQRCPSGMTTSREGAVSRDERSEYLAFACCALNTLVEADVVRIQELLGSCKQDQHISAAVQRCVLHAAEITQHMRNMQLHSPTLHHIALPCCAETRRGWSRVILFRRAGATVSTRHIPAGVPLAGPWRMQALRNRRHNSRLSSSSSSRVRLCTAWLQPNHWCRWCLRQQQRLPGADMPCWAVQCGRSEGQQQLPGLPVGADYAGCWER